jgi:hypothetical protein
MMTLAPDIAARLRVLFTLDDSGGIVWAERPAADFAARYNITPAAAAAIAQDWQDTKAGKAPRWKMTPNGPAVMADKRSVLFWHIVAALGADPARAQAAADAAQAEYDTRDTRGAVLRLCAIDHKTGQIVWRKRTQDNAPKTPKDKRDTFNRTWAGRALTIRDGALTIQRKTVQESDARQWLQEAAKQE